MSPSTQLERIQTRARERMSNDGLHPFQREYADTFQTLLCYLLGMDAITDADLDMALTFLAESDARTVEHNAAVAS